MRRVDLSALLKVYEVGSGDWGWLVEFDKLWSHPSQYMDKLTRWIARDGIQEPVLLGSDGRVWDGHHRIVAAMTIGLDTVPVEFSGQTDE